MILISGLSSVLPPDVALGWLILPTLITNGWQALRQGVRAAWESIRRFRLFRAKAIAACPILAAHIGIPLVPFCHAGIKRCLGAH